VPPNSELLIVRSGYEKWGGLTAPSGSYFLAMKNNRGNGAYVSQPLDVHKNRVYTANFQVAMRKGFGSPKLRVSVSGRKLHEIVPTQNFAAHSVSFVTHSRVITLKFENIQTDRENTVLLDAITIQEHPTTTTTTTTTKRESAVAARMSKHHKVDDYEMKRMGIFKVGEKVMARKAGIWKKATIVKELNSNVFAIRWDSKSQEDTAKSRDQLRIVVQHHGHRNHSHHKHYWFEDLGKLKDHPAHSHNDSNNSNNSNNSNDSNTSQNKSLAATKHPCSNLHGLGFTFFLLAAHFARPCH